MQTTMSRRSPNTRIRRSFFYASLITLTVSQIGLQPAFAQNSSAVCPILKFDQNDDVAKNRFLKELNSAPHILLLRHDEKVDNGKLGKGEKKNELTERGKQHARKVRGWLSGFSPSEPISYIRVRGKPRIKQTATAVAEGPGSSEDSLAFQEVPWESIEEIVAGIERRSGGQGNHIVIVDSDRLKELKLPPKSELNPPSTDDWNRLACGEGALLRISTTEKPQCVSRFFPEEWGYFVGEKKELTTPDWINDPPKTSKKSKLCEYDNGCSACAKIDRLD